MKGISLGEGVFSELFQPLLTEFEELYWMVDFQCSPFDWKWAEKHSDFLNAVWVNIPLLENTSTSIWLPHAFPNIAFGLTRIDEWSYFTGFKTNKADLDKIVEELEMRSKNYGDFLEFINQIDGIHLIQADGWWEIYTPKVEWLNSLQQHTKGRVIDSVNINQNYSNL